jgi:hypothetical protein
MRLRALVLVAAAAGGLVLARTADAQRAPGPSLSVSALAHHARVRTALGELMPPERSVPQVGLEITARTFWSPMTLGARVLRSTGGADDLHSEEAGLLISGRYIGVEAAYSRRGSYSPTSGLAHDRIAEFGRAGIRARMGLGGTGFSLHLRAHAYVPTWRAALAEDDIEGWDGETGLRYALTSLPVAAAMGYRLERFRIFGVEQEVSALTFSVGYSLGR